VGSLRLVSRPTDAFAVSSTLRARLLPTKPSQRVFAESSGSDPGVRVARDPTGHRLAHGDMEEGFDGLGGAFDIAGESPIDAGTRRRCVARSGGRR
jgi:hypothetical protein